MAITAYGTTFTPKCAASTGTALSTGVTTAATAYDWFALSGSGALYTAISAMSTATAAGIQNKAFALSIANLAKTALLPLVKAELFATTVADLKTTITDAVDNAYNSLTSIQLTNIDTATKTALSAAYTAETAIITAALNRVKTLENKVYLVGDSIDVLASSGTGNIATAYAAVTTLTSFTSAKTYLSTNLDPASLGNGGTAIPSLTASTYANAATLATIYGTGATGAGTALAASTLVSQLQALVSMSANTVFDHYCACEQGYLSSATTGKWASGSAPVGVVPGIDFEVHLTGAYQTGVAAAGTPGAPSATTNFW